MENSDFSDFVNEYCNFYCLSYKHPKREAAMKDRFSKIGIPLIVYGGVEHDDKRLQNMKLSEGVRRLWSITYGHLDMIQMFLDSGKEYGLFMENDILIRKDLTEKLPRVMEQLNQGEIEFCLLGYMITHAVNPFSSIYHTKYTKNGKMVYDRTFEHRLHMYPHDQWGVHLYMMNRSGAQKILDTYAGGYADEHIDNPEKPFSPDWTISKCPDVNRALLYPMLAVEDGSDSYDHYAHDGQYNFHMETFRFNYIKDIFI